MNPDSLTLAHPPRTSRTKEHLPTYLTPSALAHLLLSLAEDITSWRRRFCFDDSRLWTFALHETSLRKHGSETPRCYLETGKFGISRMIRYDTIRIRYAYIHNSESVGFSGVAAHTTFCLWEEQIEKGEVLGFGMIYWELCYRRWRRDLSYFARPVGWLVGWFFPGVEDVHRIMFWEAWGLFMSIWKECMCLSLESTEPMMGWPLSADMASRRGCRAWCGFGAGPKTGGIGGLRQAGLVTLRAAHA